MKKVMGYYGIAMFSLLVATSAFAAPTHTTAATITWVGLSSDANGYFLAYSSIDNATIHATCSTNSNRVYFHQWVNDAGSLVAQDATRLDQMLRLATAAYLSGRPVRLGIEVAAGKCYTRQVFLQ